MMGQMQLQDMIQQQMLQQQMMGYPTGPGMMLPPQAMPGPPVKSHAHRFCFEFLHVRGFEVIDDGLCLQSMMMGPYTPTMPFSPSYSPEYGYDQHAHGEYQGGYFQGDRYDSNAAYREDFHHHRDDRRGRDHHTRFKSAEEMSDEGNEAQKI
jgi:hypothetical protein